MEDVLDTYAEPYDAGRPVVCVDEGGKQLIGDVREPLPVRPGSPAKQDHEYERGGMANLFGGEGGFGFRASGQGEALCSIYGAVDYIDLQPQEVVTIDTSKNQLIQGAAARVGPSPVSIAITPDGSRAYVVNAFTTVCGALACLPVTGTVTPVIIGTSPLLAAGSSFQLPNSASPIDACTLRVSLVPTASTAFRSRPAMKSSLTASRTQPWNMARGKKPEP